MTQPQRKPIVWTDEVLEDVINGAFTVTRFDHDVPYRLTRQEKEAFERGKSQGYVIVGKRNNLRNAFCTWCEIHKEPYIYAEPRGKYMRVAMDLIFCEGPHGYRGPLFEEKLLSVVSAVGQKNSSYSAGGTYNDVEYVLPENAEYTARAFWAIYQQYKGIEVKAPAFPGGTKYSPMFAQVTESREGKFAICTKGRMWLHRRWEVFCKAYNWPYVVVDEKRKGTAKVKADFSTTRPVPEDVQIAIMQHVQEVGLQNSKKTAKFPDDLFISGNRINDTYIRMLHAIPTIDAISFAKAIVKILDEAGYFPVVDDSWHE